MFMCAIATYEPAIGRWLSGDPLGFIDGTSLYRAYFVPNYVDPSGNVSLTCFWRRVGEQNEVLKFTVSMNTKQDCVVNPFYDAETGIPCGDTCEERCKGNIWPVISFEAILERGADASIFSTGTNHKLRACDEEEPLKLSDVVIENKPYGEYTTKKLSASIVGKNCKSGCCGGWNDGMAYIQQNGRPNPRIEIYWAYNAMECGWVTFESIRVGLGKGDNGTHALRCVKN